jgi:hypothetical protein
MNAGVSMTSADVMDGRGKREDGRDGGKREDGREV